MASNPESFADIIKEMRNFALEREHAKYAPAPNWVVGSDTRMFANRLEAAHQRDVAKLRETLRQAIVEYCHDCEAHIDGKCVSKAGNCFVQEWRKVFEETKGVNQ